MEDSERLGCASPRSTPRRSIQFSSESDCRCQEQREATAFPLHSGDAVHMESFPQKHGTSKVKWLLYKMLPTSQSSFFAGRTQPILASIFRKKTRGEQQPVFVRNRKRFKTVAWKYKKNIGIFASFVFICNQILASGLLSMPAVLNDVGWFSSILSNLLFCFLSSTCSLLLLKTMTLIEGNSNFDERYEYSAIFRHFVLTFEGIDNKALVQSEKEEVKGFPKSTQDRSVAPTDASLVRLGRRWDAILNIMQFWRHSVKRVRSVGRHSRNSPLRADKVSRRRLLNLPRLLAFVLYVSQFLAACSASLLVAYCLDALCLRALSWTVFIPIIPVGSTSFAENTLQFFSNAWNLVLWSTVPCQLVFQIARRLLAVLYPSLQLPTLSTHFSIPSFNPVLFISTPLQLEQIFSGVCEKCVSPAVSFVSDASSTKALYDTVCTLWDAPRQMLPPTASTTMSHDACEPCIGYIGVSLGYIVTALAGMRLAASDLEDTMRLQFVSFGSTIATVINVCCFAMYNLLRGGSDSVLEGNVLVESDQSSLPHHFSNLNFVHGTNLSHISMLTPWLAVLKEYWATSIIPTFIDAYGFPSALPSWANEVKDEVPVTSVVWASSIASSLIFFIFGALFSVAFPSIATSQNVLAALIHRPVTVFSMFCTLWISIFHVFSLFPSIVLSQITSRYDLLNMAICLDKRSAFFYASTLPWMGYWIMTYQPFFAKPASVLTLLTGLVLNFIIPTLTFIYASSLCGRQSVAPSHGTRSLGTGNPAKIDNGSTKLKTEGITSERLMAYTNTHEAPEGRMLIASGAVAGKGTARTREMQRQLQQWLLEFTNRAPDSELAKLMKHQEEADDSDLSQTYVSAENAPVSCGSKSVAQPNPGPHVSEASDTQPDVPSITVDGAPVDCLPSEHVPNKLENQDHQQKDLLMSQGIIPATGASTASVIDTAPSTVQKGDQRTFSRIRKRLGTRTSVSTSASSGIVGGSTSVQPAAQSTHQVDVSTSGDASTGWVAALHHPSCGGCVTEVKVSRQDQTNPPAGDADLVYVSSGVGGKGALDAAGDTQMRDDQHANRRVCVQDVSQCIDSTVTRRRKRTTCLKPGFNTLTTSLENSSGLEITGGDTGQLSVSLCCGTGDRSHPVVSKSSTLNETRTVDELHSINLETVCEDGVQHQESHALVPALNHRISESSISGAAFGSDQAANEAGIDPIAFQISDQAAQDRTDDSRQNSNRINSLQITDDCALRTRRRSGTYTGCAIGLIEDETSSATSTMVHKHEICGGISESKPHQRLESGGSSPSPLEQSNEFDSIVSHRLPLKRSSSENMDHIDHLRSYEDCTSASEHRRFNDCVSKPTQSTPTCAISAVSVVQQNSKYARTLRTPWSTDDHYRARVTVFPLLSARQERSAALLVLFLVCVCAFAALAAETIGVLTF